MGGWSLPLIVVVKTQKRKSECGVDGTQTRIPHRMVSVLSLNLQPLPPVPLAPYAPPGHSSYPHRLNGFNYEKQKIVSIAYILMLSHDYLLRQRDCSEHGSRPGYGVRTPPVASDLLDLSQVCSLLLSCSQHVNELAFCSRGWTRTHHLPVAGGSALELHGWPSSREAMTKTSERA